MGLVAAHDRSAPSPKTARGFRSGVLTLGLIVVIILAVSPTTASEIRTVRATSTNTWVPTRLDIATGDIVRWRNPSSRTHNLKATSKNWTLRRVLDPGESVRRTFGNKGTYKYRCLLHSGIVGGVCQGMCGSVRVLAG